PYFCFGHGLSYTTFSYSNLKLSSENIKIGESVEVSIDVTNTGTRLGDEVVQMYIKDKVGSTTRPSKELKGFKRIVLSPNQTETVKFNITPEALSFTGLDYKTIIEAGEFEVMVGTSSEKYSTVLLTVNN
ncbi:fibronectin type III-like domain-contianing protein, partial [Clostridium grantii]